MADDLHEKWNNLRISGDYEEGDIVIVKDWVKEDSQAAELCSLVGRLLIKKLIKL